MRRCRQIPVVMAAFLAFVSVAGFSHGAPLPFVRVSDDIKQEPNAVIFVRMFGKCRTLRIDGRDLKCRAVAFVQNEEGRASFTIAIDDPDDDSHIVSFSGDNGRKSENIYELPIDRMLLKSKDRPKLDNLPVPLVDLSAGLCRQIGNFLIKRIASISCTAIDKSGKKYELEYESDGTPVEVLRIKQRPVGSPSMSPFD